MRIKHTGPEMEHRIDILPTIWQNIASLMKHHWGGENMTRLAADADIGAGTVARLKKLETHPTVTTLSQIAALFDVEVWQLMVPGLDPAHPPTLQPMNERERELYNKFKDMARAIASETEAPPYKT